MSWETKTTVESLLKRVNQLEVDVAKLMQANDNATAPPPLLAPGQFTVQGFIDELRRVPGDATLFVSCQNQIYPVTDAVAVSKYECPNRFGLQFSAEGGKPMTKDELVGAIAGLKPHNDEPTWAFPVVPNVSYVPERIGMLSFKSYVIGLIEA